MVFCFLYFVPFIIQIVNTAVAIDCFLLFVSPFAWIIGIKSLALAERPEAIFQAIFIPFHVCLKKELYLYTILPSKNQPFVTIENKNILRRTKLFFILFFLRNSK